MKRENYLSWQEYFMGIAFLSAKRSKDPVTQVGACIVMDDKIIGIGYNGFPKGNNDDSMPWGKEGDYLETKYPYVVHAELNAILNSNRSVKDATIYVTKVIYFSDKHKDKDSTKASVRMLKNAGIEVERIDLKIDEINIKFED